jgi:hypothetical protein
MNKHNAPIKSCLRKTDPPQRKQVRFSENIQRRVELPPPVKPLISKPTTADKENTKRKWKKLF